MDSLKRIIEEESPSVVILVETKLGEEEKMDIEGYEPFPMNRDENGGGIIILVKDQLKNIVVVVEKNREVGESMWLTITNGKINIRLGVVYAPQEKTNLKELRKMYKGISNQLKEAKNRNQNLLLVGDFNCKVGNKVIKGNTEKLSKGGKLLVEMAKKQDLKIMNGSEKCQGTWTRTDGKKSSILDYVIVDKDDEELVKEMVIDEGRDFTPNHTVDGRCVYSDHFAIRFEINWNLQHKTGENMKTVVNEKSNAEFKKRTTDANLTQIWNTPGNLQEKYSEWSRQVSLIAENTYLQKKKRKKERKEVRTLRNRKKEIKKKFENSTPEERKILISRKKLINQHIENHKRAENKKRMIKLASEIKSKNGFNGGAFWEYKRRNSGRKREEMTAIKDEDGQLEEDPQRILKIYQNFYQTLLKGKKMETLKGKATENIVDKYVDILLQQAEKNRIQPFSEEEYQQMKKQLQNRKAPDLQGWRYEMVKYAGEDLERSLLIMFNELATNNIIAEEWVHMVIKAISKMKGDLQAMSSKRGLFLTNILSKVMEKLVKNRTKPKVTGISEFQCGGITNREIGDNLLIVNTVIEEFRAMNTDLFILFADLEKCFDQLWLRDCIKEMVEAGMPKAEAAYIFKMNSKVKAVVETPVGRTEPFELAEIVRQGTVCAVDLCGVSTDKINRLKDDEEPLIVSGTEIKHPVYVDDMIGLGTASMIEKMEPKMRYLEESKKYVFNNEKGKTEIMQVKLNNRKKDQVQKPVVEVKKGEIGYTDSYKCLGDQYDQTGRNLSKIKKKMSKANFIAAEVKRQGRYENVGSADTSVRTFLLDTVVAQTLLFNTKTWVNMTKEEKKAVDKEHYMILRKIFEQKQNTPYAGILLETGLWPYSIVIVYLRLMYFHNLMHSDEKRTTKKMILNQMAGEGKGKSWYSEGVEPWIVKLDLKDLEENIGDVKKSEWKRKVKEGLRSCVEKELMNKKEDMTKLRFTQSFEKQSYIKDCPMAKVKKIMKLKLNMVDLKANFKGKYRDVLCPACGVEEETTEHVLTCEEYKKLTGHTLKKPSNWMEKMNDTEWLLEACEVYEQIEEVRSWLV